MTAAPKKVTLEDYTPDQHLIASVGTLKKLEAQNERLQQQMFQTLNSPFKISTKVCDAQRQEVLVCYQRETQGGEASTIHRCVEPVAAYRQCVNDKMKEHGTLSSEFVKRNQEREKEITPQAEMGV